MYALVACRQRIEDIEATRLEEDLALLAQGHHGDVLAGFRDCAAPILMSFHTSILTHRTDRRSSTMPATKPYKAAAAFVLTFLGTLLASIQGRKEFGDLTALEWLIVVGSALVTTGVVYGISNPPVDRR